MIYASDFGVKFLGSISLTLIFSVFTCFVAQNSRVTGCPNLPSLTLFGLDLPNDSYLVAATRPLCRLDGHYKGQLRLGNTSHLWKIIMFLDGSKARKTGVGESKMQIASRSWLNRAFFGLPWRGCLDEVGEPHFWKYTGWSGHWMRKMMTNQWI